MARRGREAVPGWSAAAATLRIACRAIRAFGTENPAMPERIESMRCLCLGNICRSRSARPVAADDACYDRIGRSLPAWLERAL